MVDTENRALVERWVTIQEIADAVGLDRSNTLKAIKAVRSRLHLTLHKTRTPESRGQRVTCMSQADADKFIAYRRREGFVVASTESRQVSGRPADIGVFYVITLIPEHSVARVKLGYAESIAERMAQHRTTCPTARVEKTWPCKNTWERAALDAAIKGGAKLVQGEVFDCPKLEDLIAHLDRFFATLPEPSDRVELSEHSPLRGGPA